MSDIRKICQIGADSGGVTLPKDDLRDEGILDENDELTTSFVRVEKKAEGKWSVERI